ncbi:variable large family protein [Borrelia duttonii]|uniref:Variable large protein n=1 Tax=Borrelia duttonii (strain Ly) TaxID=412419 RepID=B5RP10_BORDL|nr:vlp protein, alpha subfamily [Borrelia duttonii Ly]
MNIEKKGEGKVRVILLMMMMVMMGCNSGGVKGEGTGGGDGRGLSGAMMEVGRSAENAFYAFIELMSDALGLKVTKDTKKNAVGEYFNGLSGKLEKASDELEKVASKATSGVDKSDESKNAIRVAVDAAKEVLSSLKIHLESLGQVGDANLVGWTASNSAGTKAEESVLKKVLKALQGIVNIAKTEGVPEPKAENTAVKVNNLDNKNGAKILATDNAPGATDSDKAALIVSSVSGENILASIIKSQEGHAKALSDNADENTTPLEFAVGGTSAHLSTADTPRSAAVAGGIALRSLVKDGKLASNNNDNDKAVQAVGITAVNKLLVSVEDMIKKTVKNVLEKVKKGVDEARKPKNPVSQ